MSPCPCCGSDDLDFGVQSAQSVGVKCRECGLMMTRYIPDRWPCGVWVDGKSANFNMRRLEVWTALKAVKAWNKRKKPCR